MDGWPVFTVSAHLSLQTPHFSLERGGISQFAPVKNDWNPAQQDQPLVIPAPQTDPQSEPDAPVSRQKDYPSQAAIPAPPYLF